MADYEDERAKVWAFASRRGRDSMEDQHFVSVNLPGNRTLVGVFDGHCGVEASKFCSQVFTRYFLANPAYSSGNFATALHQTFMQMDRLLRGSQELLDKISIPLDEDGLPAFTGEEEDMQIDIDFGMIKEEHGYGELKARFPKDHGYLQEYLYPGTTATVALIVDKKVIVANAGDSYCCLVRDGKMVNLTMDHHKGLKGDDARVEKGGGVFVDDDSGYLYFKNDPDAMSYGGVSMTRCLGDIQFKMNKELGFEHQVLSPVPDIVELDLVRSDQYLMLATDGVCRSYVDRWEEIEKICKAKEAGEEYEFRVPSEGFFPDNATLIVIKLKQAAEIREDDPKPVRRFSWYTENKILGYEAEEVDMRPWKIQDREKHPEEEWRIWIDELPDLSDAEKAALRDYIEVKFSKDDAAKFAEDLKKQFEIFESSLGLAETMRSMNAEPGGTDKLVAEMRAAKETTIQYLRDVGSSLRSSAVIGTRG